MSKLANLLVAAAIALSASSLTACTQDGEDGLTEGVTPESAIGLAVVYDIADRPAYEAQAAALEAHTTSDPRAALETPEAVDEFLLGEGESAVCECTDEACASAWVEETVGCGTCILVICDGGARSGGCSPECAE